MSKALRPTALLVLGVAILPAPAAAHTGSGSGSAGFFEAMGLLTLGVCAVGVGVVTYLDVRSISNRTPESSGLVWGQALFGGGLAGVAAYAYAGGFVQKDEATPRSLPGWVLPLFAAPAAAAGFGVAAIASDGPRWWGIGAATGLTTLLAVHSIGALSGVPHRTEASMWQVGLSLPGLAVGVASFAAADATPNERRAGFTLMGVSGALAIMGVLDATLGTHVEGTAASNAAPLAVVPMITKSTRGVAMTAVF